MAIDVFADPQCRLHRGYLPLAERPERLDGLIALFAALGLATRPAVPASDDALALAHDLAYVRHVRALSHHRLLGQFGDYAASLASPYLQHYLRPMASTFTAATHAAGSVLAAVSAALATPRYRGFCAVRPPGHHAGPARGEGFCFFNNTALGALHAARAGLRTAIVDFDHHHGNGTQAIVESRGDDAILFVSSHWEGCKYAQAARHTPHRRTIQVPIASGSRIEAVGDGYARAALPALRQFRPDLLILSAGFDMHEEDPLSSVRMRSEDYATLTGRIAEAAGSDGALRIVSVLEGGYRVPALRDCVRHHLAALDA